MSDATTRASLTIANTDDPSELGQLIAEARSVSNRIRDLHRRLADEPDDGGAVEEEMLDLIRQRRDLEALIGTALVRWVALGGEVELHPAPTVVEAPEPILVAATEVPVDPAVDAIPGGEHQRHLDAAQGLPADPGEDQPDLEAVEAPPAEPEPEPAPEPKFPPVKSPERASKAALQALARNGLSPNWDRNRSAAAQQRSLRAILREIGKPARPSTRNKVRQAVTEITAAVTRMDAWLEHPQDVQRGLMGLISSMARHLQDEAKQPLDAGETSELGAVFSRMTRWSGEHRPGFVPGLSRSNGPETESWIEDARLWWSRLQEIAHPDGEAAESPAGLLRELEERLEAGGMARSDLVAAVREVVHAGVPQSDPRLVALLVPHRAAIQGAGGLKTLKSQLRQAARTEAAPPAASAEADLGVPVDWPLFERTRDRTAVIVGGDDRPHAADRIQAAFGFASIEWEKGQTRRSLALAERIRAGRSVDVVILLREFVSHEFPDRLVPACKEAGVDLVVVDKGYGVTQVRLAFERFLGGPTAK